MHSTAQPQQLLLAASMHSMAAGCDMEASHPLHGSYSRSNSASRAASRAGHLQETPSVPSRPHSRLAQQCESSCIAQQHQQLQHCAAATAGHGHSSCSSGVDEQGHMPGQVHRPGSRLGHHTDMHSPQRQQQQTWLESTHASSATAVHGAAAAGAGAAAVLGYADRQHSSRGARASSSCFSEEGTPCSATTPTTPGTPNSSIWRANSRPGSVRQQQQQQQQDTAHVASYEEMSEGTYMAAIPERPGSSLGMQGQYQQPQAAAVRRANPLFAHNSSAAALLASNAAAVAGPASRAASAAAGSLRDRSSPMVTPRRLAGYYAAAISNGVCSATRATTSGCTRPASSSGRASGGNSISSTISNLAVPGSMNNKQQSAIPHPSNAADSNRPYSASKQGNRPSSSAGRSSGQQQQQQQQQAICNRSQALPAGVLSQDPAPAAARLGAAYLRSSSSSTSKSSSMSKSRPSSAAKQPAAAAGSAELRCPSRQQQQPYRQRQQSAVEATASSAASVLAATPRNRPRSTSSRRPGSAAAKASSQQQQLGEAQGPLLSEYFRPPSAAAPGSISMFGLPGMEPPNGLASVVPSVKVPSVHASWDAGVGGLLGASSRSSWAVASPKAGSASTGGLAAPTALCSQVDCAEAGRSQQQQHKQQSVRPGTTPAATAAAEAFGCRSSAQNAARPESSKCVRRLGSAAVGRDAADAAGVQQLLLWSATHEIDGRPVTRNGERARQATEGGNSSDGCVF